MAHDDESWRPHPFVLRVAAYAACLLVVGAAAWLVVTFVAQLALVLFPLVLATFFVRILGPPNAWLRRRGWRPAPAAATVLLGSVILAVGAGAAIGPPMIEEGRNLGPTIEEALADIEDWIVRDTGFDITQEDIDEFKEDISERARQALEDSQDQVAEGARLALAAIAGFILSLVLTFFALKDGPRFQSWIVRTTPEPRRRELVLVGRAGWTSLGGFLRGAALLGVVEAAVIGAAMAIVGAKLVLPVMLLTFLAAFVPIVGATVAGIIAVLVTLAGAGLTQAIVVGVVVILVQQFDNDLLAPWIYGKQLSLHPALILVSITAGTALFGFVGTVLAVPLTAVVMSGFIAVREDRAGVLGDPDLSEADLSEADVSEADVGADPDPPAGGAAPPDG